MVAHPLVDWPTSLSAILAGINTCSCRSHLMYPLVGCGRHIAQLGLYTTFTRRDATDLGGGRLGGGGGGFHFFAGGGGGSFMTGFLAAGPWAAILALLPSAADARSLRVPEGGGACAAAAADGGLKAGAAGGLLITFAGGGGNDAGCARGGVKAARGGGWPVATVWSWRPCSGACGAPEGDG